MEKNKLVELWKWIISLNKIELLSTCICSGRISQRPSDAGCNSSAGVSAGASLSKLPDISSFALCSSASRHSLPQISIFIRLLCCLGSSPSKSWVTKLAFLFLCVPSSDEPLWDPDSTPWPTKHFAHPPVSSPPTKRCDSSFSLWLHSGLCSGSWLWAPRFLSSCLTRAETQGLGWGSWLRHLSRWRTVVRGRTR